MSRATLLRGGLCLLAACNPDPGELTEQVGYRDGTDGGSSSGERGSVKIAEILWSGSVTNEGVWDPSDVFVELRNESARSINISGWQLELEGAVMRTVVLPDNDLTLPVGGQLFIAAKTTGCFPEPDLVVPDLVFPNGDRFALTLTDKDERLMETAGNPDMPPFAGGYDLVVSRSMERITLMFGSDGNVPQTWQFYTGFGTADADGLYKVDGNANNDRVSASCRKYTLASPGRANSPDYAGAFASGSFE